jgi:hypothetical protein
MQDDAPAGRVGGRAQSALPDRVSLAMRVSDQGLHRSTTPDMKRPLLILAVMSMASPVRIEAQDVDPGITLSAHYALKTGSPFSGVSTVTVAMLELAAARHLLHGARWSLEWPVAILPATFVLHTPVESAYMENGSWLVFGSDFRTSRGFGVKPIGLRVLWHGKAFSTYLGAAGGVVWFDHAVPAGNGHRRNYLGDLDAGLRLPIASRVLAQLGYRFTHLSNGGKGEVNHGIDSHMISFGMALRR